MQKALITGINGQDGAYLCKLLLAKGYHIVGSYRLNQNSDNSLKNLISLNIDINSPPIELINLDLTDLNAISNLVEKYKPDELYNLAAFTNTSQINPNIIEINTINGLSVAKLLESIEKYSPKTKFCQASTAYIFSPSTEVLIEESPFNPLNLYGISKLNAHLSTNYFRTKGLFACNAILFNQESPLKTDQFVFRKVVKTLYEIKVGIKDKLSLGNIDSCRDWGYAADYVEAMWLMLQQNKPEDFIIATGKKHSVRDIIQATLQELDFQVEWQGQNEEEICIDTKTKKVLIQINKDFYRPNENVSLIGDSSKAKKILKWIPKTSFNDLVYKMIKAEKDKNLI